MSQGLVCGVLPLPTSRRARVPAVRRVRLAARGERGLRVMSFATRAHFCGSARRQAPRVGGAAKLGGEPGKGDAIMDV